MPPSTTDKKAAAKAAPLKTADQSVSVHQALNAVMEAVGAVAKHDRNQQQNFSFRGIDSVVNAVSPWLRVHGVVVVPELVSSEYGTVNVGSGERVRQMAHVQLVVKYIFYGPTGDYVSAVVPGEAFDAGDKATPKAMSVAFRTALLQTLSLPTDEPDPDSQTYERAEPPPPAVDPLNAAKALVKVAWEKRMGGWSVDEVAEHFASWSGGEVLADALAPRLAEYAGYLDKLEDPAAPVAAEDDKPATKEPLGIARDLAGDPEELAAERRADGGDAAKGET